MKHIQLYEAFNNNPIIYIMFYNMHEAKLFIDSEVLNNNKILIEFRKCSNENFYIPMLSGNENDPKLFMIKITSNSIEGVFEHYTNNYETGEYYDSIKINFDDYTTPQFEKNPAVIYVYSEEYYAIKYVVAQLNGNLKRFNKNSNIWKFLKLNLY